METLETIIGLVVIIAIVNGIWKWFAFKLMAGDFKVNRWDNPGLPEPPDIWAFWTIWSRKDD